MRLAFLIPSLEIGGAERAVALISKELSRSTEVAVIIFRRPVMYDLSCPLYLLEDRSAGRITRFISYVSFLNNYRPDAVISLLTSAHTLNALTPHRVRKFLWFQNYPTGLNIRHPIFYGINAVKFLTIYHVADGILAVSRALRDVLIRQHYAAPSKTHVLYNPIDNELIKKLSREEITPEEESALGDPTIVNVGRLVWQKGQWHLIRSFKKVTEELRKSKLIIIGGGPLERRLHSYVERLGLRGRVVLMGPRLNPPKLVARSDLFAFPSIKEGFSLALLEALACGTPVVSSDCLSGPREALAPRTSYKFGSLASPEFADYGILMPVPDGIMRGPESPLTKEEDVWAETMISTLQDDNLLKRYRERGPLRSADFDVRLITKQMLEIVNGYINK